MTRPATPGSAHPADGPADTRGNGTRPISYAEPDLDEDETVNDALVATPGHGGVAVFQAPQPARGRPAPPATTSTNPPPLDGPDIDSPFLDLFGGAMPAPAAARPTSQPAPGATNQPAIAPQQGTSPRALGTRPATGRPDHAEPPGVPLDPPPRPGPGWAAHPAELPAWEPDELPEPAARTRAAEATGGVPAIDPARRRIAAGPPTQRAGSAAGPATRPRIPEQPAHPSAAPESPHPAAARRAVPGRSSGGPARPRGTTEPARTTTDRGRPPVHRPRPAPPRSRSDPDRPGPAPHRSRPGPTAGRSRPRAGRPRPTRRRPTGTAHRHRTEPDAGTDRTEGEDRPIAPPGVGTEADPGPPAEGEVQRP